MTDADKELVERAPERISVYPHFNDHHNPPTDDWTNGHWDSDEVCTGSVEYVRADRLTTLSARVEELEGALREIASMVEPDDMEEDEDGFTEWGCPAEDAIPMAYENAIWSARAALSDREEDAT